MLALDRKIQAKHYYGSVEFGGFRFYEKMPPLKFMHKFINSTRLIRIVARLVCYRFVLYCMPVNHVHTCMIYHQIFDGHPIGFCVCTKFMNNAHTAQWMVVRICHCHVITSK